MHILLVGSGGREHALAWKIAQSPLMRKLTLVPGSDAMAAYGTRADVPVADLPAFAKAEGVDLVVVGPEVPLADGLADRMADVGIAVFGPTAAGAQVETSKSWLKDLCREAGIPIPRYAAFSAADAAKAYLSTLPGPYVVKADGLAAGKGVVICDTHETAATAIDAMFAGQFGDAGQTVVIEEYLQGTEVSAFALTDGDTLLWAGAAQDHKRAFDGGAGPNTGGMGGFSPSPLCTDRIQEQIMDEIFRPTLDALKARGITYRGALYAGLFITSDGPKLIEYNCRFGDPECQMLMRCLRSDIVPALWGAATGRLGGIAFDWQPVAAANIVHATKGYPDQYEKGSKIDGLAEAADIEGAIAFHAGTKIDGDTVTAQGGRVLNVTAIGADLKTALDRAYAASAKIVWPEGFYRRDLGHIYRKG